MIRLRNCAFVFLAAVSYAGVAAQAETVTLTSGTLTTTNLATSGPKSLSAGGVTATFSAQTGDSVMSVDGDGIFVQGLGDLLNVTFDSNVSITGYGIGFANDGTTGNIEFYVDNGDSTFAPGVTAGSYTLASPITVNVGSVLTINGNPTDVSQINALSFAVPEPSSLGLLALGGLALARRRRGA